MRRIAAIVLPDIACELARRDRLAEQTFAVIVDENEPIANAVPTLQLSLEKTATIHAVDQEAWRYGARPGQRASQAAAYVAELNVVRLSKAKVLETLGTLAEVCLELGTISALTLNVQATSRSSQRLPVRDEAKAAIFRYPLGAGAGPHDTVWLDVTGCAALVGGEDVLCSMLQERARDLGHRARVAIANGPRIAQALARWAPSAQLVAPPEGNANALRELSVAALPLDSPMITWLAKLGILRIDDLAQLDRARLSHRLGPAARDLLELIAGRDDVPLHSYQPTRRIVESTSFEHEIKNTEPLMFVLRGLASRAISRLAARGEACTRTKIQLGFDRSVIELENRNNPQPLAHTLELTLELPVPLSRESELLRALSARLERTVLDAPVVSLTLVLDDLTEQNRPQLELGGAAGVDPSALPILLAELNAQLGSERVGVLEVVDDHRPEARSKLIPVAIELLSSNTGKRQHREHAPSLLDRESPESELPTRILPKPVPIPAPSRGALLMIDKRTFTVHGLRHCERLDQVQWWSPDPLNRDYARVRMSSAVDGHGDDDRRADDSRGGSSWDQHRHSKRNSTEENRSEAWLFFDRSTGKAYLHGWFE